MIYTDGTPTIVSRNVAPLPAPRRHWNTLDDIEAANRAIGHHWFDPATLVFFDSKIDRRIIGGRFFLTSEYSGFSDSSPRRVTIREVDSSGQVTTYGEFCEFPDTAAGRALARDVALAASVR